VAPFDLDPRGHAQLVLCVAQELVFEAGLEILEPAGVRTSGRAQMRPGLADRDAEVLGDALGELAGDVDLARRRVVAVLEDGHGRERQLVGDAWVVDIEGGGKNRPPTKQWASASEAPSQS